MADAGLKYSTSASLRTRDNLRYNLGANLPVVVVLLSACDELATTFNNSCSSGVDLIKQKGDIESNSMAIQQRRYSFSVRFKEKRYLPKAALCTANG